MSTEAKPACHPRKRFSIKAAAESAARNIANLSHQWRHVDPCQHCNGWHLSSPDPRGSRT